MPTSRSLLSHNPNDPILFYIMPQRGAETAYRWVCADCLAERATTGYTVEIVDAQQGLLHPAGGTTCADCADSFSIATPGLPEALQPEGD